MINRSFFFGVLIGTAVFVYLISSFLIATLDITLWKDSYRFFAVVAYIILVVNLLGRTPSTKVNKTMKAEGIVPKGDITQDKKESEIEKSHFS